MKGVIQMGWYEWMVVIAVLIFALRLAYEEIRKRLFGEGKGQSNRGLLEESKDISGQPESRSDAIDEKEDLKENDVDMGMKSERYERAPIQITNIEIYDSVINRSSILSSDEDDDKDTSVEIEDSVVRRSTIGKEKEEHVDE